MIRFDYAPSTALSAAASYFVVFIFACVAMVIIRSLDPSDGVLADLRSLVLALAISAPMALAIHKWRKISMEAYLSVSDAALTGKLPLWRGFRARLPLRDIHLPLADIRSLREDFHIWRLFGVPLIFARAAVTLQGGRGLTLHVRRDDQRHKLGKLDMFRGSEPEHARFGRNVLEALSKKLDRPIAAPVYRDHGEMILALLRGGEPATPAALGAPEASRARQAFGLVVGALVILGLATFVGDFFELFGVD